MFRLVLHASHQNKRENIMERVVSACSDLMFEEFHIDFTLEFMFVFVISNENGSSEETRNQLSNQEYPEVLVENEEPVDHKENTFIFEDWGYKRVKLPFQEQEWELVELVIMLDIFVLGDVVCEHVMLKKLTKNIR